MAESKKNRKPTVVPAEVSVTELQDSLGSLLSRAGFGGERIPITRHGKRIAALVSSRDLEKLEGVA